MKSVVGSSQITMDNVNLECTVPSVDEGPRLEYDQGAEDSSDDHL